MIGFVCELTPKCNLHCRFCYNTWRDPSVTQPQPLSAETFATLLIPTLKQSAAQWLAFAGGEPLLYPELNLLMKLISEQLPQVKLGILSNGVSLSNKRLRELIQVGLNYVELSLFTSSSTRYQALTGANMLERVHTTILHVKAQNLPLTIACTLLADGLDEFEEIIHTAFALGADAIALNPFTPTGYGLKQQGKFYLSQQQLHLFLEQAQNLATILPMPMSVTLPVEDCLLPHKNYPNLYFNPCQCGLNKWVIDPEGNLRICEQNPEIIGSLLTHSFSELSIKQKVMDFRIKNHKAECFDCKEYQQCGGGCRFRQALKPDEIED